MIDYNSREIVITLLKKWYIIFFAMIVFGAVSVPSARMSYQKAESDYNQLMHETQEKNKKQMKIYYDIGEQSPGNVYIFMDCMSDDELMKSILRGRNSEYQWEKVSTLMKYQYVEEENVFKIEISAATEDEIDFLISAITNWLPKYLEENGFQKITFNEMLCLQNEIVGEEKLNTVLVNEPVELMQPVKTVILAAIFGMVLSCGVILLNDYTKKAKQFV